MRVRVPPRPPAAARVNIYIAAYVVGVALGDGNLSNPNGRAIRLRITCDNRYPNVSKKIIRALQTLFPKNKVSVIKRQKSFHDISVYSNTLALLLPWKQGRGPKQSQNARVPKWIRVRKSLVKECLRGLFETDGSIYRDRGYVMVNFSNNTKSLAEDVFAMASAIGFKPTFHMARIKGKNIKYTVRIARESRAFLKEIQLKKN